MLLVGTVANITVANKIVIHELLVIISSYRAGGDSDKYKGYRALGNYFGASSNYCNCQAYGSAGGDSDKYSYVAGGDYYSHGSTCVKHKELMVILTNNKVTVLVVIVISTRAICSWW